MQTRAVIEAAIAVNKEGYNVVPEIMIPLLGSVNELKYIREVVEKTIKEVLEENNTQLEYKFATMVEVSRGALTTNEIVEYAEFSVLEFNYGFLICFLIYIFM